MFDFHPWPTFKAFRDKRVDRIFLTGLGRDAATKFIDEQTKPKSGRFYRKKGGRIHQASAPGEYPAKDTGILRESEEFDVYGTSRVTVGNTQIYSVFLREGTDFMQRRKMSDNALEETTEGARHLLEGWIRWKKT